MTVSLLLAITLGSKALGVPCAHCHVDGNPSDAAKPTFEFAQRMNRMVAALNAGPLKDVAAISCWTCHRGQAIPARLPRDAWEKIRANHMSEFADQPNRAVTMSVYAASLGVDWRALSRRRSRAQHEDGQDHGARKDAADLRGDSEALRQGETGAGDTVLHVPPGQGET